MSVTVGSWKEPTAHDDQGEDVAAQARFSGDWSIGAIAQYLGRDRKPIRAYRWQSQRRLGAHLTERVLGNDANPGGVGGRQGTSLDNSVPNRQRPGTLTRASAKSFRPSNTTLHGGGAVCNPARPPTRPSRAYSPMSSHATTGAGWRTPEVSKTLTLDIVATAARCQSKWLSRRAESETLI